MASEPTTSRRSPSRLPTGSPGRSPSINRVTQSAMTGAGGDQAVSEAQASLTERAYTVLEEMIVCLDLPPGSEVSESRLSASIGIGRTPVREALQRLSRDRLVRILPRRGVVVSEIDVAAQLRLLEVRREIERFIAGAAARRAQPQERLVFARMAEEFGASSRTGDVPAFLRVDRAFNDWCLLAARNEFAYTALMPLHSLSRRFWYLHNRKNADLETVAALHARMARTIAAGDAQAAAAACDVLVDKAVALTRGVQDHEASRPG